jgi:hypothetical protein
MSSSSSRETEQRSDSNTPTPQTTANGKPVSFIYVGPSIPGGALIRFTVFRGGKPSHLQQLFADCQAVEKLLVPVQKLSESLAQLNKTGTPQHTWYGQVVEFIQKGAK